MRLCLLDRLKKIIINKNENGTCFTIYCKSIWHLSHGCTVPCQPLGKHMEDAVIHR